MFYLWYILGLGRGLVSPIVDLVIGVVGAIRLVSSAVKWLDDWSPPGIMRSPARQMKLLQLGLRLIGIAARIPMRPSRISFAIRPARSRSSRASSTIS